MESQQSVSISVSTEERNWGAESWRAPKPEAGDDIICSEYGRIMDRTDFRSHWFMLVHARNGPYFLLVKHGGGEERFSLGHSNRFAHIFAKLDSDDRYRLLHTLFNVNHDAASLAAEITAKIYRKAFAEGKLKKRKLTGQDAVKVWIEQ